MSMATVEISYELGPKHPRASIIGNIGDRIDLYGMPLDAMEELTIDFAKVNYINSIGVKNWISWISRVPKNLKLNYVNCIPAIVNQLNSVIGFIPPNGSVESFFVPYACDNCGREERIVATRNQNYEYPSTKRPPHPDIAESIACPKCSQAMELDMLPSRYYSFLEGPKTII